MFTQEIHPTKQKVPNKTKNPRNKNLVVMAILHPSFTRIAESGGPKTKKGPWRKNRNPSKVPHTLPLSFCSRFVHLFSVGVAAAVQ